MNNDQRMPDCDVLVLGAGAAGLVAAARSAQAGARTILLEKNRKAGAKILMSGGTRCNITQDCDAGGIMEAFGKQGKFLRQAIASLDPRDTVRMFERLGVPTKVEATGKVFPASDRAVHVRDALLDQTSRSGAEIRLASPVENLRLDEHVWCAATSAGEVRAHSVIVTVGGRSWPGCGTTGDGYAWMESLGHTVVRPRPALVPLVGGTDWTKGLSGLTIDNVHVGLWLPERTKPEKRFSKRPAEQRTSSFLFTHFGFSGPAVMDVSRALGVSTPDAFARLRCDWIPHRSIAEIEGWLQSKRESSGGQHVATTLAEVLPRRLAQTLTECAGVSQTPLGELSGRARHQLLQMMKQCDLPVSGTRGFEKAEVTAGGVKLKEVNPRTMASRKHPGLFIAGEILDLDGWIGGYNFQSAFSTGHVAGMCAAEYARGTYHAQQ